MTPPADPIPQSQPYAREYARLIAAGHPESVAAQLAYQFALGALAQTNQHVTVTVRTPRVSMSDRTHYGHFAMTLVTCGMWLPVWLIHYWILRRANRLSS